MRVWGGACTLQSCNQTPWNDHDVRWLVRPSVTGPIIHSEALICAPGKEKISHTGTAAEFLDPRLKIPDCDIFYNKITKQSKGRMDASIRCVFAIARHFFHSFHCSADTEWSRALTDILNKRTCTPDPRPTNKRPVNYKARGLSIGQPNG